MHAWGRVAQRDRVLRARTRQDYETMMHGKGLDLLLYIADNSEHRRGTGCAPALSGLFFGTAAAATSETRVDRGLGEDMLLTVKSVGKVPPLA